jgi:thiamine phosphate synthase YjbQ (UPF0047 family)
MSVITVQSKAREEVIDVTADVARAVASMRDGACTLFVQHTTRALTILTTEDGIAEDLLTVLDGQRVVLVEFEGPRERTTDVSG